MRLTCPNCGARYEVDDALIPPEGRDVQCSDCFTTWFQAGPRMAVQAPQTPRAAIAEPEDELAQQPAPTAEAAITDETSDEAANAKRVDVDTAPEPPPEAEPDPDRVRDPEPDQAEAVGDAALSDTPTDIHDTPLAELPENAESATQIVAENDMPDPEAEEHTDTDQPDDAAARRGIDPDVREILRAEADREARLRQAEAGPVETQSEMPLDAAPEDQRLARRRAELEDAEDAFAVGAASAAHANASRRDLLPDIEEINSTLRATEDRQDDEGEDPIAAERAIAAQRRRGVRVGFFATLALTGALIWVYFNAEMLSQAAPGVAGAVDGFTTQVDGARFWLDDLAQGLTTPDEGS